MIEPSKRVSLYQPRQEFPLAIVAQSPGARELEQGEPLVGPSGKLLRGCFEKAELPFDDCLRTNVIGFKPPSNDFTYFCVKKKSEIPKDYPYEKISTQVGYLHPDWFPELERLKDELLDYSPNLVLACGAEALWALCGVGAIVKYRGSIMESTLVPGLKVLPTRHPAAALRDYSLRAIILQDLFKAAAEVKTKGIDFRDRVISIYPDSAAELWAWYRRQDPVPGAPVSVDIETRQGTITCIGFSFYSDAALVVPFWSDLRAGHNYWPDEEEELAAWEFAEKILKRHPVIGQNYYAYDTYYQAMTLGILPGQLGVDTMILHHNYQPELPKDLGFLTSIYCNEPAYKTLRPRGQKADKRDE